jgi:hypothetical protein
MPAPHRFISPLLAIAMMPMLAGRCVGQTYRDDERHFSIELPKGWQPMTKSELAQVNSTIGGGFLGGVHYDGGLRHSSDRLGKFPYVLIQSVKGPPSGASFEEIEKSLSIDLRAPIKEAQGRFGDVVRDLKIGQPALDRKSKVVIMNTQSTVNGVGATKGLSMGHLGRDNIVFIHCYAKANEFNDCLASFTRINDWFSFDRGYDFKPGTGSIGFLSWGGAGRGGLVGGAIGLIVGLVSFFVRMINKPSTPKPAPLVESEVDSLFERLKNGEGTT